MQAVILAAGMGRRLRSVSDTLPKGLLTIGQRTLLEYSLQALQRYGIQEVIIVTGYRAEAIVKKIGQDYHGMKIRYVKNDSYDSTGSMFSLFCARGLIGGDSLILESDLLYDQKAVGLLLDSPFPDAILVGRISNSGDEVYVLADEKGRLLELGKKMSCEKKKAAAGELVGISRLSKKFLEALFNKAEEDFKKGERNRHYEECIGDTNRIGYPMYVVKAADLTWIEIDKEEDLKKAQEVIFPALSGL